MRKTVVKEMLGFRNDPRRLRALESRFEDYSCFMRSHVLRADLGPPVSASLDLVVRVAKGARV